MIKLLHIADFINATPRHIGQRTGAPSDVLIVAAGGLGDTILFSLVLPRFLSLAKEGEKIYLLLRKSSVKGAFLLPPEITVISIDFGLLHTDLGYRKKVMNELFNSNFRFVVSADFLRHPDLDEALIKASQPQESAAMEPAAWKKYDRQLIKNRKMYSKLFNSGPKVSDKILRWTSFANWLLNEDAPPPKISIPLNKLAKPCPVSKPFCIIQPFSAVKEKQSPPSLYEKLLPILPENMDIRITGTVNDIENNPEFQCLLSKKNISFDTSTLEELVPVLRAAKLVVSVDTAVMHLAVSVGAPTLCLASAAYVNEIIPYALETMPTNVRFVYKDMPCRGCLGSCRFPAEQQMYPCVANINWHLVKTAAKELLQTNLAR